MRGLYFLVVTLYVSACVSGETLEERMRHARTLLQEVPLVDGHNDMVTNIREVALSRLEDFPFEMNLTEIDPWPSVEFSQTDLPRLRAGQVGGQFWSVWVPCSSQYKNVVTQTLEQIDLLKRFFQKYSTDLQFVTTADGKRHNDMVTNIREVALSRLEDFPFEMNLTEIDPWPSVEFSQTDLPRLRAGQVGGQFWSVWVPCSSQYKNVVTQTLEQIDLLKRFFQKYSTDLQFVTTADGIWESFAAGKIGSLIALEGGHSIDSSLALLRIFYREGVRYMTLTHSCNTPWADSSVAEEENDGQLEFGGLTEWGQMVVMEMNRLGMLVDISHLASETMHQVLNITRAPVIFSHSDCRAICNVTRNVPDDVLARMPDNGGVVMVNFYSYFLSCSYNATIQDIVANINHIRDIAGVDHVGIGSDFDGINVVPEGLEDVSKYPDLFAELLLDPSWSDDDLKKLAGLNVIRALKEAERVRDELFYEAPWDQMIPAEDIEDHLNCSSPWP